MNSTVLGGWSATPDQWLTSAEVQRTRDTVVLAHFDLAPAWNRLPACHHYNLLLTLVFSICLYSSPLLHYSAMFKRFFFFFFFFIHRNATAVSCTCELLTLKLLQQYVGLSFVVVKAHGTLKRPRIYLSTSSGVRWHLDIMTYHGKFVRKKRRK